MRQVVTIVRTTYGDWRDKWVSSDYKFALRVSFKLLSVCTNYTRVTVLVLTTHIQEEVLWCMLFADGMNAKLERWQEALQFKGIKISNQKREYMNCNSSGMCKEM